MRARWIQFGYIHANLPLSEEQRRSVEKRANRYANRRLWFVLTMIVATIGLPLGVIGGGTVATKWILEVIPERTIAASIGYIGMCALCVFLYLRVVWSSYREPMRRALRDEGFDVCVGCGYWLRALKDDVAYCPECGIPREALQHQPFISKEPLGMNWRWLLLDHVPPSIRLSKQERQRLTTIVKQIPLPLSIRSELAGFFIGLPLFIVANIGLYQLTAFMGLGFGVYELLGRVVMFVVMNWFIFAGVNHLFRRRHTLHALRVMGYDMCRDCGYWLRGLGEDVKQCPECGTAREPMPSNVESVL